MWDLSKGAQPLSRKAGTIILFCLPAQCAFLAFLLTRCLALSLLSINDFSSAQSQSSTEDAKMNGMWLYIPLTVRGMGTDG